MENHPDVVCETFFIEQRKKTYHVRRQNSYGTNSFSVRHNQRAFKASKEQLSTAPTDTLVTTKTTKTIHILQGEVENSPDVFRFFVWSGIWV